MRLLLFRATGEKMNFNKEVYRDAISRCPNVLDGLFGAIRVICWV